MLSDDRSSIADNDLVRIALKNREHFGLLYDRYAVRIYKFCYRRLGNRDEAEDVTSAIFIRAIERLDTFRDGSFAAWLFSIARTSVTDRFRARVIEPLPSSHDPVDLELSPLDTVIADDRTRSLRFLVSQLPDNQRAVIELRLAGLTGAEIAEVIERTIAAVKMLQLRSLRRMREIAANQFPEDSR